MKLWKKREKRKLLNSMIGLYNTLVSIYRGSEHISDKSLMGILLHAQLTALLDFHKEETERQGIVFPKLGDIYTTYIQNWNLKITGMEQHFKSMIDDFYGKSKKDPDYII